MSIDNTIPDRVKLNIDLAKRNLVDTIYDQAILEGVATTFADTASIIEGGKVNIPMPVKISGTSWQPPIPLETDVKKELTPLVKDDSSDAIGTAINLILYVMKRQIFIDGNKRTAVIFANHYLIAHGAGLIVIPAGKVEQFKQLLINYYEDEKAKPVICDFLRQERLLAMPQ